MHVRNNIWLVLIPALCVALLAVGCSTNPATGKSQLSFSREKEIAIGADAAPEFEKQFGGEVANEDLQAYVRSIGAKVSAKNVTEEEWPYEYTVLNSDIPNAFALPGGKIYITAGLMRAMTNERQLAGVLGHETGHVDARHSMDQIQQQMIAGGLASIVGYAIGGDAGAVAEMATKVATKMATLKYSRDDEKESDMLGIHYMTMAGYNPWGMVELLQVLDSFSESKGGAFTEMMQTHPLTANRIADAEEIIRSGDEYKKYSADTPDPRAGAFMKIRALLPPPADKE